MRKICIVTGSRAEYGLLSRLMKLIDEDNSLILQIIATNMHLSPEFGLTYKEIEADGFIIDKKVQMLLSSDTPNATAKSVGLATIGFADAFEDLKPDLLLVLGDRYEILAAVTAAMFYKIPVAHLHGGEITEGAYDDAIRHAITKMSHLHFSSSEEYRSRVIQLGEDPENVFNVGSIGIDNIKHLKLLSQNDLEENLNFTFGEKCVLVTFHPVTLENDTAEEQMHCLLEALSSIEKLKIIFTLPNSDTGGRIIIKMIHNYVRNNNQKSISVSSLGQLKYFSSLQYVSAVVGNSSSGLIEAPSFNIPTLNIGNRQQGRLKSKTVIDCEPTVKDIREKLLMILTPEFKKGCQENSNPYQKANTAKEIFSIIKKIPISNLIHKSFNNL
ncbi:MAG: UDP-N-acetylglucosamine 2-epimerase [Bacteroidota bacterium]|jgi:UDP-N-acetylglucosamine 2-epimerase (non-hydrolysing)/GDP/UDP-N,N'-diacetylbacillosamine 2-epimerase (hydrolysing)